MFCVFVYLDFVLSRYYLNETTRESSILFPFRANRDGLI